MTDTTHVSAGHAEFRAAGTDLSERRRSGVSRGSVLDIAPTAEMTEISGDASAGVRIGASVTIDSIAGDPRIRLAYPGLAATAAGLATPQIRHVATLGGNLAQRTRCWYYRNPNIACLKKGGSTCPARAGNHLYGVAFDLGPCVAPHPSSMAAALLAYEATVTTNQRQGLTLQSLLGDGSNGHSDHALQAGEVIQTISLPPALAHEKAYYKRAIGRAHAEWPLAELIVRVVIADSVFQYVRLAAGGIAPVPIRLKGAEAALAGVPANAAAIAIAARQSVAAANPLPLTRYKLELVSGLVHDLLHRTLSL